MSWRTSAHVDQKISKSRERKRYLLKTIVRLSVGWCSLSASFEHCVRPLPERDLIKWGIITTAGVCYSCLEDHGLSVLLRAASDQCL